MFDFAVILFIVLLATYVILFHSTQPAIDSALLLLAASALTWSYMKTQYFSFEGFDNNATTFLTENYSSISKDLVQYFSVFDKRSYIDGQKQWKNIVRIKGFNCDTSLTLTKVPKYFVQTGIELGENSLIGPLSNTMNIKFGSPFTICFAATMKQLVSASNKNIIELFKMYANSPNNNGLHLYIQTDTIDTNNGNNSGSLYFQFADQQPVLCKLSTQDSRINFPQNTLLFFVIIRQANSVRLVLINERTDKIEEIASLNFESDDITFSNKELVINRLGNWNANMFNVAYFNNALNDIRLTSFYMYVKDLYTKYNNPAYLDALQRYLDSLKAYNALKTCPFPKSVCDKCKSVDDWSNFTSIVNAPLTCKQAIAKYCSSNPTHPFCECWNKTSPKYTSTTCVLLRALYSNNKDIVCENVCKIPKESSILSQVQYKGEYTFDKVKINYPWDTDYLATDNAEDTTTTDVSTIAPIETQSWLQKIVSWFT
jgi:hypothetical protein